MPSVRNIPAVWAHYEKYKYDIHVVKFKPEIQAYTEGRNYFLSHDYTHWIICPDDLEVPPEKLEVLIDDIKKYNYQTVAGFCNLDETNPDTYAIQPTGCDYTARSPQVTFGAWYTKKTLPSGKIIQVGFSGFAAQVISRELVEKIDYMNEQSGVTGNLDWEFAKLCDKLQIPLYVDVGVQLYHRRFEEYDQAKNFARESFNYEGYSFLILPEK